jgi:hypothetical protein
VLKVEKDLYFVNNNGVECSIAATPANRKNDMVRVIAIARL